MAAKKAGLIKRVWRWLVAPQITYFPDSPTKTKASSAKKSKAVRQTTKPKKKKQRLSAEEVELTRWGFVDASGNVRLRGGDQKIVGKAGGDKKSSLLKYAELFEKNKQAVESGLTQAEAAEDPVKSLTNLRALEDGLKSDPGLGDVQGLERKLSGMIAEIQTQADANKSRKLKLIKDADEWSGSSNWLQADRAFQRLSATWSDLPSAGVENDGPLAKRFESARSSFEERREFSFNDHEGNAAAKRACIADMELLAQGEGWEEADIRVSELVARWKFYGPAGAEEAELSQQFEATKSAFIESYSIYTQRREQEAGLAESEKRNLIAAMRTLNSQDIVDESALRSVRDQKDDLVNQWHDLGSATEEFDADLNQEFSDLEKAVFARVRNFSNEQKEARQSAAKVKQDIVAELRTLSDPEPIKIHWKEAEKTRKELEEKWKECSSAGRGDDSALNKAWNEARKTFFDKRSAFFEIREEQRAVALERKKILISDLPLFPIGSGSRDLQLRLEESLAAWKKAGSAGRDHDDTLWESYREARELVYEEVRNLRSVEREEFTENLGAAFTRKKDQLYKLEDMLRHDLMLQEREKNDKTARQIKQTERRIEELKTEILTMQRKLERLQTPREEMKKAEPKPEQADGNPEEQSSTLAEAG